MASSHANNRAVPVKKSTLLVAPSAASKGNSTINALQALGTVTHVFNGTGVPGSVGQVAGDVFIRTDTLAVANQRIYIYNGTVWTPVL